MNGIFCDACCGIFKCAVYALLLCCIAHIFYSTSVLKSDTLLSLLYFLSLLSSNGIATVCNGFSGTKPEPIT
jgi:hypothetical protein